MRTSSIRLDCLCLLACLPVLGQTQPGRPEAPPQEKKEAAGIHIVVVEGEGAINSIKQRFGKDLVVRVEDDDSHPVKGAMVTFQLPDLGPSGRLANGGTMSTLATDAQGMARLRGLQPNSAQGDFQIKVSASFGGQTASTVVTQTNVEAVDSTTGSAATPGKTPTNATPSAGRGSSKALWILIIAGGAGGAIAAASAGHHGSSTSSITAGPTPPATGIVITPGAPSVGGPH